MRRQSTARSQRSTDRQSRMATLLTVVLTTQILYSGGDRAGDQIQVG